MNEACSNEKCRGQLLKQGLHGLGHGLELLLVFAPFYQSSSLLVVNPRAKIFSLWIFCGTEFVYLPVKPYIKGIKYTVAIWYSQFILYSLYVSL